MHIHEDTTPAREDRLTTVVCFKYEIFKLAVITTYSLAFRGRFPGGGGEGGERGYSLSWPIRGGSTRKGYIFLASGI